MSHKCFKNSLALVCLIFSTSAFAQNDGSISILQQGLTEALDQVFTMLQGVAIQWLGIFMILQFTWTHWQLIINDSDITKVFAKFASSLFWFGICIYIFKNGSDFIKNVSREIMTKATGSTGAVFDPIQPISTGIDVASQLLETLNGTQSILQSLNPFPSIMMGIVSVVILAVSALLAFKILMVFIETKMVIALSPLSFALLGLNAFKDQGLAPFKYLVSMAIRMFLYGAVLVAMGRFSTAIIAAFKALPAASDPSVWPPIWAAAMGYVLLGAVAMRVDSIAVMLASGSSQMSTGDAAAVGAAAGAAKGGGQSMTDFMKNMGSSAISNAGQQGGGGLAKPAAATSPAMASQGGGKAGGAPSAPGAQSAQNVVSGDSGPDPRKRPPGDSKSAPDSGGVPVPGAMPRGPETQSWKDSAGPQSDTTPDAPSAKADSGASSSIGGAGDPNADMRKDLARMADQMAVQNQLRKPTLSEKLGNLNRLPTENASPVHIQMNTHQSD